MTDDKQVANLHKEIEFRNRAKRNMWITIFVFFFVITYVSLYSLVLYLGPDDKCRITDNKWVRSFSTVLERHIQYILWLYPLLWLFWPAEASCQCGRNRKKKKKDGTTSGGMHVSTRSNLDDTSPMSINSKVQD